MGPGGLHRVAADSLVGLLASLEGLSPGRGDLILAVPAGRSLVIGDSQELWHAAAPFEGAICVAASPLPLASPALADQTAQAVAESAGHPLARCHPHPHALLGRADQLGALLADIAHGGNDADLLTSAILSGRHDFVLDTDGALFHVLDGTRTDLVVVAGRVHAGRQQPMVLIDLAADGAALPLIGAEIRAQGARDLARILRYDDAVDAGAPLSAAAADLLVTRLWTQPFCAAIVRAAEAAGVWKGDPEEPTAEVSLQDLSPRLVAHLTRDLDQRIWPQLRTHWPELNAGGLEALVVRDQADGSTERPAPPRSPAQMSGSIRLNDGYQGGALTFPRQEWDDNRAPVGSLTLWPTFLTHPHRVQPLTLGVKYHLALRWKLP